TSFNGQKQQRIDITADALYNEKQENLKFKPRSSMLAKTFEHNSSSLGRQCQMVSAENNTLGPALFLNVQKTLNTAVQASVVNLKWCLLKITIQAPFLNVQMTSDHKRSELRIHDHSNEPSSSKLVLKVVPLAVKTATS
ncbi:hypothetical protein Tco_0172366, partial [Tanacetum coccineum]